MRISLRSGLCAAIVAAQALSTQPTVAQTIRSFGNINTSVAVHGSIVVEPTTGSTFKASGVLQATTRSRRGVLTSSEFSIDAQTTVAPYASSGSWSNLRQPNPSQPTAERVTNTVSFLALQEDSLFQALSRYEMITAGIHPDAAQGVTLVRHQIDFSLTAEDLALLAAPGPVAITVSGAPVTIQIAGDTRTFKAYDDTLWAAMLQKMNGDLHRGLERGGPPPPITREEFDQYRLPGGGTLSPERWAYIDEQARGITLVNSNTGTGTVGTSDSVSVGVTEGVNVRGDVAARNPQLVGWLSTPPLPIVTKAKTILEKLNDGVWWLDAQFKSLWDPIAEDLGLPFWLYQH